MNFSPEYLTYYISELSDNGERIDIAPHFKYLTEKELQVCKGRLAIHLAKLQVKADKITQSLQDPKATSGYPRTCLENKIITLRKEIKNLEDKYDQILLPNFPICRPSSKNKRTSLPFGVSLFLPRFELDESEEKVLKTRLSIERISEGACAFPRASPRVTEEIKWESAAATNLSIVERVDDFISEPVDEIFRQLREERDFERRSHHTSTPDLRNVRRPLPNWDANADLLTAEPGISETVSNLISLSSSPDDSDSDDRFYFGRHYITAAEMAQITQNMVDTLRQAGEDNTTALVTGMRNLNAQRKLEGIPFFSGDSNCTLVIDEWFKIAERVARLAGWTDPQKIIYFQEKLTKSAAHFNDSLDAAQRDVYDD